jgi:hypothetical protein
VRREALPDRCSLCDRLVLGLAGQDWCVLPWMFDAGVTDDEVLPGSCHVRCLHELGVARLWAESVQEYYCLRWPQWRRGLTAGVRWRLHCSPRARRFHLWRADGRLSSFPFSALTTPFSALTTRRPFSSHAAGHAFSSPAEGRAFPGLATGRPELAELTTEVGEIGSVHSATLLAAMGTDENGVAVPLADVVAALGLTDRYPVVDGFLIRRLKNLGMPRRPDLVDILVAHYSLPLDAPCVRAAHELIRSLA